MQADADDTITLHNTLTRIVVDADGASTMGRELVRHYLAGADAARSQRQNTNLILAVLNTYTLGALGLDAHPDNALVSSLAGNLVSRVDGVNNAGGERAWLDALLQTNCISQQLEPAYRLEAYDRASWGTIPDLSAAYSGMMRTAANGYVAAYLSYRVASDQAVLKVDEPPPKTDKLKGPSFPAEQKDVMLAALNGSTAAMRACTAAS